MGTKAANAIHRYLTGEEMMDLTGFQPVSLPAALDPGDAFLNSRQTMPLRPAEARIRDFNVVELGYTEEMAIAEAHRCLRCSLRLAIEEN